MSESVNNNIEVVENPILAIKDLSVYYGDKKAIKSVSVGVEENKISAIMGPSGCGKSTLLRAINRMHQLYSNTKIEGEIFLSGRDCTTLDPILLRRKIGMVFQRPNPFPTMSIYDNVIAGFKLNGIKLPKGEKDAVVERCLIDVGLWDEVKDNLKDRGSFLSGGQQQRLCIARAIASEPEVLLMDEPTSALDPIATKRIEELITKLKNKVTIVLVTHNMSQAARVSDRSLFMYLGELVEYGSTQEMFTVPKDKRTEEYLTGKFG